MPRRLLLAVLVLGLLVSAGAVVSAPTSDEEASPSRISAQDRKFIKEGILAKLVGLELGRLADERAISQDVKQLAQRIRDGHARAKDELMGLAQARGVTPPLDLHPTQGSLMERLARLSGADFDRAYLNTTLEQARVEARLLQARARRWDDPEVKGWAVKTLLMVQGHARTTSDLIGTLRE